VIWLSERRPAGLLWVVSVVVAVSVMLAACKPARATPQPRFSVADFARLGWLAGDWQSRTQDGRSFYDRYRVIDDSTMRQASFSDSNFRTQTYSAVIGLRDGRVIDRGDGAPWFATRIDTNGANFEPEAAAANHIVWTRVSPDRWTTQIFITYRTGAKTQTVYQVERVKRK